MERRPRLHVLSALAASLLALASSSGQAAVFMTQPQALAEAFPGARIERKPFVLTDAQVKTLQQRARAKLTSKLVVEYLAWRGDTLIGTAWFDTRVVRTMPAVLMVVVAPDRSVERVDVLAFHEPPDYRPTPRWLGLFPGQRLDDRLRAGAGVRYLSGATLSTRAVIDATRLALALYEELIAPAAQR